jgi:EAL domain-containing protein (putative c-di-GMP-specific phosphodiesterase class I)
MYGDHAPRGGAVRAPSDRVEVSFSATTERSALDRVVRGGELRALYQPLVDLATLDTIGYEALARGPAGSALERPDQLFDAAAREGLVAKLDLACREAAVAGAAEAGLGVGATLFVNVEPAGVRPELPFLGARALEAVARAGFHVVAELTERALTLRPRELFGLVNLLRERGYGVALDDVGAHEGSLALMPLISPDVIKLDLELVRSRPDAELARVVHAVQAEAERTGAVVVAEGIESEEYLDRALALGAEFGQGWLFGHPDRMPHAPAAPASPLRLSRLEAAAAPAPTPFSALAGRRPTRRGDKSLLLALSRMLEARAAELGREAVVLATFQDDRFFTAASARRYEELARRAAFVGAFGVGLSAEPAPGVRGVALQESEPLRGEWNVVVIGPHFAGGFAARDLGDDGPDEKRRFDFAMTHDRDLVIEAGRSMMRRTAPLG